MTTMREAKFSKFDFDRNMRKLKQSRKQTSIIGKAALEANRRRILDECGLQGKVVDPLQNLSSELLLTIRRSSMKKGQENALIDIVRKLCTLQETLTTNLCSEIRKMQIAVEKKERKHEHELQRCRAAQLERQDATQSAHLEELSRTREEISHERKRYEALLQQSERKLADIQQKADLVVKKKQEELGKSFETRVELEVQKLRESLEKEQELKLKYELDRLSQEYGAIMKAKHGKVAELQKQKEDRDSQLLQTLQASEEMMRQLKNLQSEKEEITTNYSELQCELLEKENQWKVKESQYLEDLERRSQAREDANVYHQKQLELLAERKREQFEKIESKVKASIEKQQTKIRLLQQELAKETQRADEATLLLNKLNDGFQIRAAEKENVPEPKTTVPECT